METHQQTTSQNQPSDPQNKPNSFKYVPIIGLLVLIPVVVFIAYSFGLRQQSDRTTPLTKSAISPSVEPTQEVSTQLNNKEQTDTGTVYNPDLDVTLDVPPGWTLTVKNRDPLAPSDTVIPCYPSNKEFYKDPGKCIDAADTFLIGINTSQENKKEWPNTDISLVGPTSGLGGGCPPEEFNMFTKELMINNKPYKVSYGQNKSTETYLDCFQFPFIKESGEASKWSQFSVMFHVKDKETLDQLFTMLQTARFGR